MKKIIKAALSGALVMGMLAAQCFSTSAMIRPIITGDVDWNSKVDVNDVTLLQRYIAGETEVITSKDALTATNFNKDGNIDVLDVTDIQTFIANSEN